MTRYILHAGGLAACLSLAACQTYGEPSHPLEGTNWRLVDIETSDTSTRLTDELSSRHTLGFAEDGRLQMQLDCNRGNAGWSASMPEADRGTLTVGPIASTRALCPKPTYGEELAAGLSATTGYTLTADHTALVIRARDTVYTFIRD